jgi:hypothetical protein
LAPPAAPNLIGGFDFSLIGVSFDVEDDTLDAFADDERELAAA